MRVSIRKEESAVIEGYSTFLNPVSVFSYPSYLQYFQPSKCKSYSKEKLINLSYSHGLNDVVVVVIVVALVVVVEVEVVVVLVVVVVVPVLFAVTPELSKE